MSGLDPLDSISGPREEAGRPGLIAFGVLALGLGLAYATGSGRFHAALALTLLLGAPLAAARLGGSPGRVFILLSALGGWLVFRQGHGGAVALPALLVNRLCYLALPPLVVDIALGEIGKKRLRLEPFHLWAPAGAMAVAAFVHLALRWSAPSATSEAEIRTAALVYGICYTALLAVGLLVRLFSIEPRASAPAVDRVTSLEETGRFRMASRLHEREGSAEKAAQAAERGAEWARAGRLYEHAGDHFNAGEMYFRAQMWPQALECYTRARALPAAAGLCLQMGDIDRAVALYEDAGDWTAAVNTREQAGQTVTGGQYRQAGMLDEAAAAFLRAGEWVRAAEILEHDLQDPARAASVHLERGSGLRAGRLLESVGRAAEAIDAYSSVPAGAVDAARLCLAAGQLDRAAQLLSKLGPAEVDKLEDEATLSVVARVMLEKKKSDEAIRVLQGLKRRGRASGVTRMLLGRAFIDKGLRDLAQEELAAALTLPLEPGEELEGRFLLGCLNESAGRYEDALESYRKVMDQDMQYRDVEKRYRRTRLIIAQGGPQPNR